jgi:hypothetical protein
MSRIQISGVSHKSDLHFYTGFKVGKTELIFKIDCHGVDDERPFAESLPDELT